MSGLCSCLLSGLMQQLLNHWWLGITSVLLIHSYALHSSVEAQRWPNTFYKEHQVLVEGKEKKEAGVPGWG